MFNQNDWVVYPGFGVYKITETVEIAGHRLFKLCAKNFPTIMVPASRTDIIRKCASVNDVLTAFRILKNPIKQDLPKKLPMLERVISSKFKTGSIFEIADMVSMLSRYKKHRKLSVNEMRYLDMGIKQLVDEVAIAKDISKEEAHQEIMGCVI
jgi:RNA polymerase-interacting CarD/CdnL/TRCF family regulator